MGGRYKRLPEGCPRPTSEKRQALAKAIDCYEQGLELDLNAYYCSSNLPRLYRTRAKLGDEERAQTTLRLVIAACERAKRLNVADDWLRPTLTGGGLRPRRTRQGRRAGRRCAGRRPGRVEDSTSVLNDLEGQHLAGQRRRKAQATLDRHRPDQGRLTAGPERHGSFGTAEGRQHDRRNVLTGSLTASLILALGLAALAYWQFRTAESNFGIARETANNMIVSTAQGLRNVQGINVITIDIVLSAIDTSIDMLTDLHSRQSPNRSQSRVSGFEFAKTYQAAGGTINSVLS